MKIFSFHFIIIYALFNVAVNHKANGKLLNMPRTTINPNRPYTAMEFDWQNRGTYMITGCLRELHNCWETIRSDTICQLNGNGRWIYYESVCGVMREHCTAKGWDNFPYLTGYQGTMYEMECKDPPYNYFTK